MKKCSPKGRECIEKMSKSNFNCSVACEGMYADVQWVKSEEELGDEVEDEVEREFSEWEVRGSTNRKVKDMARLVYRNLKRDIGMISKTGGGELDRQKFKRLISEYKKFKREQVQYFRFDSDASSTRYG